MVACHRAYCPGKMARGRPGDICRQKNYNELTDYWRHFVCVYLSWCNISHLFWEEILIWNSIYGEIYVGERAWACFVVVFGMTWCFSLRFRRYRLSASGFSTSNAELVLFSIFLSDCNFFEQVLAHRYIRTPFLRCDGWFIIRAF